MSYIKDAFVKIDNLKISIFKVIIIHTLNNFNLYFGSYFAILSYNIWEKKKFPNISKLTKTLENK